MWFPRYSLVTDGEPHSLEGNAAAQAGFSLRSPCVTKRGLPRLGVGCYPWPRYRARDHSCVRRCSTQRLEVHHVIELVDGGSNELSNLELLCARCHRL